MFHHCRALDAQLKAKGLGMLWHRNARMGHAVRLVKVGVIQPNIHFEECWACITVLKSYMCQSFNNFFNSNTVCFTLLFIPGHSISAAQPCRDGFQAVLNYLDTHAEVQFIYKEGSL